MGLNSKGCVSGSGQGQGCPSSVGSRAGAAGTPGPTGTSQSPCAEHRPRNLAVAPCLLRPWLNGAGPEAFAFSLVLAFASY